MKKVIRDNTGYLIGFVLLLLIGVIKRMTQEKGELSLYFARWRQPELDQFFTICTRMGEEWIYVAAVLILVFVRFRYALLVPFVGLLVLVTSTSLKMFFATPRPRTFFYELFDSKELINALNVPLFVGYTSFPSGHSMSGFAIFTFVALCLPNRFAKFVLLILASLVAFSRVVITQHFLEDILAGSLLGLLLAFVVYAVQENLFTDARYWFNDRIRLGKKPDSV